MCVGVAVAHALPLPSLLYHSTTCLQCGFFKRKQSWTPEEDGLTEGEEQQGEGQGEGQGEEGEGQGEGQGEEPVTSKEKDVPSNKELV